MRHLLSSTALLAIVISTLVGAALFQATTMSAVTIGPWALLVGQVVAASRLVASLWANPLTARYLDRIAESPVVLQPVRIAMGTHPVAIELATRGLMPVVSAVVDVHPVFDVFQTQNRLITAAVGRETGSLTLVSALPDGQMLVTANMVVLPNERLIVNLASSDDCAGVLEAHRLAMGRLIANDLPPVAATSSVIADLLAIEQAGYGALGWLGGFLNLRVRRSFVGLLTTLSPEELWDLSTDGGEDQRDSARTPDYRAIDIDDDQAAEPPPVEDAPTPVLRAVG